MIHESTSPQMLGFIRIWVFTIWFVMLAVNRFYDIGELPHDVFVRIGLLKLLPLGIWSMVSVAALFWFRLVLMIVTGLAALGVRPYRVFAWAAAVGLTVEQSIVHGLRHQSHAALPLLFCAYVLAAFPAADRFALGRRNARGNSGVYSLAVVAMTLALLTTYTLIGAFRIAHSSPEIFVSDSMISFIATNHFNKPGIVATKIKLVTALLQSHRLVILLNASFAVVTAFELLAPLALISHRFRQAWLAVIVPFHFLFLVALKIFFWQNLLLFCVLLVNGNTWRQILAWLRGTASSFARWKLISSGAGRL